MSGFPCAGEYEYKLKCHAKVANVCAALLPTSSYRELYAVCCDVPGAFTSFWGLSAALQHY